MKRLRRTAERVIRAHFQRPALCRKKLGLASAADRSQVCLPCFLLGLDLPAAEDIVSWAYIGSLIQSAYVRAIKRNHAPKIDDFFVDAQPLLDAFKPSLAAAPEGVLPPCGPLLLSEMPESIKSILSQTVLQKRFREAFWESDFKSRFCDSSRQIPLSTEFPPKDWALLYTRWLMLSILRSGAKSFLSIKPDDTPFFSQYL